MLNACQIIEKIIKIIKKMKKLKKKSNIQILKIKNIKKNKCPINVKILSKTKKKKLNKKNKCQILSIKNIKKNKGLIKERILIKKLKNKKEIGSVRRITKSRNKWTVYSNSMKRTNYSTEIIFTQIENVISTRYMIG